MKKIIFCCLFIFSLSLSAYCGQQSKILLTDGSVLNGEITSYLNGIYTVKTDSFGELKISGTKVFRVESAATAVVTAQPNISSTQSQIDSYKKVIMSNPETASIVTELATDPKVKELATNPDVINAAKSGDIQALIKNEKFMDLVNNPKIEEIRNKLKK
jgi:hypothetical protein